MVDGTEECITTQTDGEDCECLWSRQMNRITAKVLDL
jgi:hypothetical protein